MSLAHPTIGIVGKVGVVVGKGAGFDVLPVSGLAASGLCMDKPFTCCGGTIIIAAEIRKVIADDCS